VAGFKSATVTTAEANLEANIPVISLLKISADSSPDLLPTLKSEVLPLLQLMDKATKELLPNSAFLLDLVPTSLPSEEIA
jgi:hypothetical protein